MIIISSVLRYFFSGGQQTVTDPAGKVMPPHRPLWIENQAFDLHLYLHSNETLHLTALRDQGLLDETLIWKESDMYFNHDTSNERAAEKSFSGAWLKHVQGNGTLHAHAFFSKQGYSHYPWSKNFNRISVTYASVPLVVHKPQPKQDARKSLLGDESSSEPVVSSEQQNDQPVEAPPRPIVPFWRPELVMHLVVDHSVFPHRQLPPNMEHFWQLDSLSLNYHPVVYFDFFWLLSSALVQVNETTTTLPLNISYSPTSLTKFLLKQQFDQSLRMQHSMGSSETETEEIKRMFLETHPVLLAVTVCVTLLHSIFDFLAFKNDVAFWKENRSLEGLSLRSILLNSFFQAVTFLYLWDNETSWVVLVSSFIGVIIEFWKLTKAVDFIRTDRFPFFTIRGKGNYTESPTAQYDREAMRYLSWVLYPLLAGYAAYSLTYDRHKSWYSFVLSTLTGCIYTFGFIMMCPQLYLNYKLQSVAHLPWRMLTYKALNTFIDDLFAFVIKMPTLHRLACLRDDVIFVIFLYQKWKYRTDYTRPNEFGFVVPEGGDAPAPALPADAAAAGDAQPVAALAPAEEAAAAEVVEEEKAQPAADAAPAETATAAEPAQPQPASSGVRKRKPREA